MAFEVCASEGWRWLVVAGQSTQSIQGGLGDKWCDITRTKALTESRASFAGKQARRQTPNHVARARTPFKIFKGARTPHRSHRFWQDHLTKKCHLHHSWRACAFLRGRFSPPIRPQLIMWQRRWAMWTCHQHTMFSPHVRRSNLRTQHTSEQYTSWTCLNYAGTANLLRLSPKYCDGHPNHATPKASEAKKRQFVSAKTAPLALTTNKNSESKAASPLSHNAKSASEFGCVTSKNERKIMMEHGHLAVVQVRRPNSIRITCHSQDLGPLVYCFAFCMPHACQVRQIQEIIVENAKKEFKAIWECNKIGIKKAH